MSALGYLAEVCKHIEQAIVSAKLDLLDLVSLDLHVNRVVVADATREHCFYVALDLKCIAEKKIKINSDRKHKQCALLNK